MLTNLMCIFLKKYKNVVLFKNVTANWTAHFILDGLAKAKPMNSYLPDSSNSYSYFSFVFPLNSNFLFPIMKT